MSRGKQIAEEVRAEEEGRAVNKTTVAIEEVKAVRAIIKEDVEVLEEHWHLGITEADFDIIYKGIDIDKEIFRHKPTDEDTYKDYSLSKLWRMNNWYKVINKDGELVWFVMNRAQHIAYAEQIRHARTIILKSRQRGISTFKMIDYFDDAIWIDNLEVGMQSYGLVESTKLLKKLDTAWTELSDFNKGLLGIGLDKSNTRAMGFSNGAQITVATSFRGDTLHRLHVSELGKIAAKDPKKANEIYTGTLQAIKAGNPATIESTAEGEHNLFHEKWYLAADHIGVRGLKDFRPVFLSWVDDPDCNSDVDEILTQEHIDFLEKVETEWEEYAKLRPGSFKLVKTQRNWFASAYRELGDKFHQEYPHTPESAFASVRDGTYYAKAWRNKGHVWESTAVYDDEGLLISGRERLYQPELAVHTAWDLGRNDMMVIVLFQIVGGDIAVIDEYHNTGEELSFYYYELLRMKKEKGYHFGKHILPHDAKVTDLSSDVPRKTVLSRLGMKGIKVLRRTKDIANDREQVRQAIPKMWIDNVTAQYIIRMMGRYTKEWDAVRGTWKEKHLHNEWSNPADAVRYMVMARMHDTNTSYENSGGKEQASRSGGSGLSSNVVDGMAM